MFKFFKRTKCDNCGKKSSKTINYAGYNICSENCMVEFFKHMTTEKLLELDKKDREINKDYYKWIYSGNGKLPFIKK